MFCDIKLFYIEEILLVLKVRSEKEKQILEFVEKHRGAPLQRSPEWFSLGKSVVGASELSALVGMTPYGTFESVALKKKEGL